MSRNGLSDTMSETDQLDYVDWAETSQSRLDGGSGVGLYFDDSDGTEEGAAS
jgi:hypothetical protein